MCAAAAEAARGLPNRTSCEEVTYSERSFAEEVARLYSSVKPLLMRRLSKRLGLVQEDAEDVVQEAFGLYWLKKPECSSPSAWLSRVAFDLAIDLVRSKARRKRLSRLAPALAPSAIENASISRAMLRQCLARLRPKARRLLLLNLLYGYDQATAAQMAGYSGSSVQRTLERARTMLRGFL